MDLEKVYSSSLVTTFFFLLCCGFFYGLIPSHIASYESPETVVCESVSCFSVSDRVL